MDFLFEISFASAANIFKAYQRRNATNIFSSETVTWKVILGLSLSLSLMPRKEAKANLFQKRFQENCLGS